MSFKPLCLCIALAAAAPIGCGDHETPPPKTAAKAMPSRTTPAPTTTTSAQNGPPQTSSSLSVSDELVKACNLHFDSTQQAPKFGFDESDLLPDDRYVLDQIGKCLTTGPLKGRRIQLVGRADSRGEDEYNMALGERRASSVKSYLSGLGVVGENIVSTSRGELDATGTDEEGWARDRRVDLVLL